MATKLEQKSAELTQHEQYMQMLTELRAKRPDMVRIEVPSTDSREGNSFYVAVNGRRMLIPYDTPVDVPYEIARSIELSRKSDKAYENRRRKMASDAVSKGIVQL